MRLYDEKRRMLKIGDKIEFTNKDTNEKIITEIIKLHNYPNFKELYKNFDKELLGYTKQEQKDYKDMNAYYSEEEQEKYGVLGIEVKLL